MTTTDSDPRKALKDIIEDKKERHRRAHENYRKWDREKEREKIVTPMDLAIQRHAEDKKKNPNKPIQTALSLEQETEAYKKIHRRYIRQYGYVPYNRETEELWESTRRRQHPDPEEKRFDWEQRRDQQRKKYQQNPLLLYNDLIHGWVPEYEKSYEEEQEERTANREARDELFHEESAENMILDSTPEKPEGITKTQWEKQLRQERKEIKEERKQRELDFHFRVFSNPQYMYEQMLNVIHCECKVEKMRAGIYCKTCNLFIPLREYTIQLFKDAAEGRSSYV